jgi:glutaredoxin 3
MARVKIFTTATCPFCIRAKDLLAQRGVNDYEEVRVDIDPSQRTVMMEVSGRRTVPQIFIDHQHIGGCDDLVDLDRRGGLVPLLNAGA